MIVHDNLRRARAEKHLARQQVADMSGISVRHYRMFESGERILTNASFFTVMKIADALDIHINELVKGGPTSF